MKKCATPTGAFACYEVAGLYEWGSGGVPKDIAQALTFLDKACQARFGGGACDSLGEIYETAPRCRATMPRR